MDREKILKGINKIEDKLLVAKIIDRSLISEKIGKVVSSDFLDPYGRSLVDKSLKLTGCSNWGFCGGYDGAERSLVVFCPNYMSLEEKLVEELITVLRVTVKGKPSLTHRDYLGALMGLGIKREKIGDILVNEDFCLIIVLNEVSEYIRYNLEKIGTSKANIDIVDTSELASFELRTSDINATVASLRLDCICGAGFLVSRSKVVDYIKGQKVFVNWEEVTNPSKILKEGDVISLRGKGRVLLQEVGRTTKKDRIHIHIKKYI